MTEIKKFNLTPRAKKAFKYAKQFAIENAHTNISSIHLFYGCLNNLSEELIIALECSEINLSIINDNKILLGFFKDNPKDFVSDFISDFNSWNEEINQIISYAEKLSEIYEQNYIGIEHIIFSILENSKNLCKYLTKNKIDTENLKIIIQDSIGNVSKPYADNNEKQLEEKIPQINSNEKKKNKPLDLYCCLLNTEAIEGKYNNISGRDKEINELIEVLSKKVKSNAILIGDSGVGKTAVVEGLAQKIVSQDVPSNLLSLQIYSVDLTSMISGTKYRGEFEERLKELIRIASNNNNIILFFDEIHNIIGTGSSTGSLDAANILKPALARGNLKCIGATTGAEYKKYFEKDTAIKRRFDPIIINAPSAEQTKVIVNNCIEHYERFHHVKYKPQIIDLIINLCEKYIPHKNFPDKAFDIVDLVGAKVKIKNFQIPKDIKDLQKFVIDKLFETQLSEDLEEQKYCEDILLQYVMSINEFNEFIKTQTFEIKTQDVIKIISEKTGLSEDTIASNNNSFINFQKNLEQEIFGQSENIKKITDILSCAKVGLNDEDKPLASLFFVGPTSVGKTYTAKKIAKHFFGNEKAFIQINMSEYQDKTGISKLIGANAGYVGFDQGGLLTEFVKNNPNCVVLFDEAEKCDPEILNVLLHLLDEGYINDNLNDKISFSKAIVIFTSNVGHDKKDKVSMGFINDSDSNSEIYQDAVKKYLKPEFVARINSILVFNELQDKEFENIINQEILKIKSKLKQQNTKIVFNNEINQFILKSLKSEKKHARNIKDIVKNEIQIPISKFIIQNPKKSNFSVKLIDNQIIIC